MKKILQLTVALLATCAINTSAQEIDCNVFLKGAHVEVGIAPNGAYGSTTNAPAGFHNNVTQFFYSPCSGSYGSVNTLGFVADPDETGWTTYFGDFFVPGDPQEGWSIQVAGAESDAFDPIYETSGTSGYSTTALTGNTTGYSDVGGIKHGYWGGAVSGSFGTLSLTQDTRLDSTKLYFTSTVVIKNTGTSAVSGIYYCRTLDPDNDEVITGGDYSTDNKIVYKLPDFENKVAVSATGLEYPDAYLALGTKDCRAVPFIINTGLAPTDNLDVIWNGHSSDYTYSDSLVADVGIGIVYNIGTLNPGDSTILSYAYVLRLTDLDSALTATAPTMTINGVPGFGADTISTCDVGDSVDVTINDGGFYTWTWSPGTGLSDTTGIHSVINMLDSTVRAGIVYTLTGTSPGSPCPAILNIAIVKGVAVAVSGNISICAGDNIDLTASSVAGATYSWAGPGGFTSTLQNPIITGASTSASGVYTLTATQGTCVGVVTDTVLVAPTPDPTYIVHPPCSGCDGSIVLYGLTPGTSVTVDYQKDGTAATPISTTVSAGGTILIGGLCAATYDSFIVSFGKCTSGYAGPFVLVASTVTAAFTMSAPRLGCDGDTVSFTNFSTVTSGTLYYTWQFGDGTSDTAVNPTHVFHKQDTFRIVLYATNGACTDTVSKTVILMHPEKAAFTLAPDTICQGQSIAFTNASIGGLPTYTWYFGDGGISTAPDPTYIYNGPGMFTVTLVETDSLSCVDSASRTVLVDPKSGVDFTTSAQSLCQGREFTFTGSFLSTGNTGNTWTFGDGGTIANQNPVYHSYDKPGTMTITLTANYRVCPDTSITKTVTVLPTPIVNLGADTSLCPGSAPITFADYINALNPNAKWAWSTGDSSSSISVDKPGYYAVTVEIGGCYASDSVWVKNDCYVDIPNAFTPNDDGTNDYFFPRQYLSSGIVNFKMSVYNRWGQEIFSTTTSDGRGWDGKFNGVPQPEGVYVYLIDVSFINGRTEHHKGNVTLLR